MPREKNSRHSKPTQRKADADRARTQETFAQAIDIHAQGFVAVQINTDGEIIQTAVSQPPSNDNHPPNKRAEDKRFRAAILKSWSKVWIVARYFYSLGAAVRIAPLVIRPDYKDRDDYGDSNDLWYSFDMIHWAKVEVKGRLLSFTAAKDFKYDDIFADRCDKIDNDPADFYVMLNRTSTHIAIISSESREHWTGPHTIFDRKKRYPVTLYSCPVEFVRFVELPVIDAEDLAA